MVQDSNEIPEEEVEITFLDSKIAGDDKGVDHIVMFPRTVRARKHNVLSDLPHGDVIIKAETAGDLVSIRIPHSNLLSYRVYRRGNKNA